MNVYTDIFPFARAQGAMPWCQFLLFQLFLQDLSLCSWWLLLYCMYKNERRAWKLITQENILYRRKTNDAYPYAGSFAKVHFAANHTQMPTIWITEITNEYCMIAGEICDRPWTRRLIFSSLWNSDTTQHHHVIQSGGRPAAELVHPIGGLVVQCGRNYYHHISVSVMLRYIYPNSEEKNGWSLLYAFSPQDQNCHSSPASFDGDSRIIANVQKKQWYATCT
jgi:hypothetical protein